MDSVASCVIERPTVEIEQISSKCTVSSACFERTLGYLELESNFSIAFMSCGCKSFHFNLCGKVVEKNKRTRLMPSGRNENVVANIGVADRRPYFPKSESKANLSP